VKPEIKGHFRELFENMSSGAAIFSAVDDGTDFILTDFNWAGELIERKRKEEVIGEKLTGVFPEFSNAGLLDILHRVWANGAPEYRLISFTGADGEKTWRENHIFKLSSGEVVNIYNDVTTTKKIEEALRESEEKYRIMVEDSNDLPYAVNEKGILTYIGPQSKRYGYLPEEIISRSFLEFVVPEDQERISQNFLTSMTTGEELLAQFRLFDKSGNIYWFEDHGRVQRDESGNIDGLSGILREISGRKKEEEARQLSEHNYKVLFESTTDGLFVFDAETMRVVISNKTAAQFFGFYFPEDTIGVNPLDYVHPDDQDRITRIIVEDLFEKDLRELNELRGITKEGREVWVEAVGTPIEYEGKMAGLVALRDITNRKSIEQALKSSEEKFRIIFENAKDEIIYFDRFGTVVDRNMKGEDILGLRYEDIIGKKISELNFTMPKDQLEKMTRMFDKSVSGEIVQGLIELEMFHKNGSTVFIEASVSHLKKDDDATEGILIILRDITERKRASEEIVQLNRELNALNTITQSVSQFIDLDEILTNALDKMLELMEIKHGAVALLDENGNHLMLNIVRGISEEQLEMLPQAEIEKSEMEGAALTGEPVFIEDLSAAIRDDQDIASQLISENRLKSAMFVPLKARGQTLGVIAAATQGNRIFTDAEKEILTTIGHAISTAIENARLNEAMSRTREMEETDRLRAAFLASISHEIRTPLTSIKGLSSTLVQPDVKWDSETQKEFLITIDHESNRLLRIVEDMLDMSMIEAGAMKLAQDVANIRSIISGTKGLIENLASDHHLEVILPDESPPVFVDEIRIGQVITNLIQNAAAYSPEGTQITLEAQVSADKMIISVTDEGEGIPSEYSEQVFDRFYRLEENTKRRKSGTGLGLAICKGIVEAHGGAIWFESTQGQGTRFIFTLPIAK